MIEATIEGLTFAATVLGACYVLALITDAYTLDRDFWTVRAYASDPETPIESGLTAVRAFSERLGKEF